jgi:hypothetical protein
MQAVQAGRRNLLLKLCFNNAKQEKACTLQAQENR